MQNLQALLEQLQVLQHDIDAASTESPEFRRTLRWLVLYTVLYVQCMADWFDERQWPLQFCAWAARSLFELEIWTRYVLKKREYAERFAKDWIMDGIGIFEALQGWSELRGMPLDPVLEKELNKLRSMRDAELPRCKHVLKIHDLVAELGMEQDYKRLNRIFSKLVHPTSWSVQWKQELLPHMRDFIVPIGLTSSARIVNAISNHIATHGMEPSPCPTS
jgi:hypothetical protein